ncbi:Pre-rRNA-processing protein ipi1 [Lepidopterella palustris CBS 459.81]|uniref:Pre-rRNA-processing protein n=1 Tax=Lepidopterella palustris CBS 459.81 TaxID=1314670 RepID=A0A8E2E6M2_9PEZI|nr:Pre-rRNA-processing protein ipi1 [Lepidopterella palustris CBS 459.81]
MGSSSKKKKEKKKDFQKPKLRVGKARPKPTNTTETSFKAKSIIIGQQSLTTTAPSVTDQFAHHLSLLKHKSDTQRRDSLAYLTSAINSTPPGSPLPQTGAVIIPEVQPLILDRSNGVREQLLKLLRSLPPAEVDSHADKLLLYMRAGMTHLAADIQLSSLDFLDWLLQDAGDEVVGCPGGWAKTLKCFLSVLRWQTDDTGKWSNPQTTLEKSGSESKLVVKQMTTLAAFLKVGIASPKEDQGQDITPNTFPLWHTHQHRLPKYSNAYRHLNLFGAPRDEDSEMYESREDRQRIFRKKAEAAIVAGSDEAKKAGGDTGRAAAQLRKVVMEAMADYSGVDDWDD